MAENISGIGYTTTTGINATGNNSKGSAKPEVEEEKKGEQPTAAPAQKQVSADDVFAMMQAQAAMNGQQVTGGYDIGKYVTPEQAERITASIIDFQAAVAKGLIDIDNEIGDLLSDEAKLALAAELAS